MVAYLVSQELDFNLFRAFSLSVSLPSAPVRPHLFFLADALPFFCYETMHIKMAHANSLMERSVWRVRLGVIGSLVLESPHGNTVDSLSKTFYPLLNSGSGKHPT